MMMVRLTGRMMLLLLFVLLMMNTAIVMRMTMIVRFAKRGDVLVDALRHVLSSGRGEARDRCAGV